ncbi:mRNA splicing factor [Gaertneriomyces semiglobifer]|nr:mRNA splicing factor [Gaertneriomyces semiglobifer]
MDLEAEAKKRQERLAALRALKASKSNGNTQSDVNSQSNIEKAHNAEVPDVVASESESAEKRDPATVEECAVQVLQEVNEAEGARGEELDLQDLAPKKSNWDLKRDMELKMAKLDRKTQSCIAELIRARLQAEGDISQVSGAADAARGTGVFGAE